MARPSNTIQKNQEFAKKAKPNFASYLPHDPTHIPEDVVRYYDREGYTLKWVRVLLEEKVDSKNIRTRMAMGFQPVTNTELTNIADLPGIAAMFESSDFDKLDGFVMSGDLALFKRPKEVEEAHNAYKIEQARNQIDGVRKQLGKETRKIMGEDNFIDESRTERIPVKFGNTSNSGSGSEN